MSDDVDAGDHCGRRCRRVNVRFGELDEWSAADLGAGRGHRSTDSVPCSLPSWSVSAPPSRWPVCVRAIWTNDVRRDPANVPQDQPDEVSPRSYSADHRSPSCSARSGRPCVLPSNLNVSTTSAHTKVSYGVPIQSPSV